MKMKKGLLTMLALLSIGGSAFAQGTVNVPEVARRAGNVNEVIVFEQTRQGVAKIQLTSFTNYRDLQFDLILPVGAIVPEGAVVSVQTAAASHTVAYEPQGVTDGKQTVRFVVYNDGQDGTAEKFVDGIAVQIPVEVNDDFVNLSTASFSKVITSNDGAESITLATSAPFPVALMKLGDVDDDGEVALNDAIYIARFTVEGHPQPFVEEVADYDGKDGIALNDAIEVARSTVTDNNTVSSKQILDIEDSIVNDMDPE